MKYIWLTKGKIVTQLWRHMKDSTLTKWSKLISEVKGLAGFMCLLITAPRPVNYFCGILVKMHKFTLIIRKYLSPYDTIYDLSSP
jgi:hypothetical protein